MYIYTISLFYIYHNNYEYRGKMLLYIESFHLIGKSTCHPRDPPVQTLTVKMSNKTSHYIDWIWGQISYFATFLVIRLCKVNLAEILTHLVFSKR